VNGLWVRGGYLLCFRPIGSFDDLETFGPEEIPADMTNGVVVVYQQDSGGGVDVFHLAP
jgi:hypothetical protein